MYPVTRHSNGPGGKKGGCKMQLGELLPAESRKKLSAQNYVVNIIREAILRGILPQGQTLRQGEVASELGVSHIPVREAFRQLEGEGLVDLYPNRGAVVAGLTPEDAREIFHIRILLETASLELAMKNLEENVFRKCEGINTEITVEKDIHKWCRLNWEFHESLYRAADSPRLLQLIQTLYSNVDRYLRLYLEVENYRQIAHEEHAAILKACRARDTKAAVGALERHLRNSSDYLAAYLARHQ